MIKTMTAVLMITLFLTPGLNASGTETPALDTLKEQVQTLVPGSLVDPAPEFNGISKELEVKKEKKKTAPLPKNFGAAYGVRFDVRDWKSCVDGWITMDIDVTVDDERFRFRPSCDFSFNRSFKTKKGRRCRVNAGMCTTWHPENAFEVTCDGGVRGEIGIPCKDSADNGVEVEPDWASCVDGWMSMSVAVRVGQESFEFHPSCDWTFSETFVTKEGGTCRAESGMCTNWRPKNRFEVSCDKGQSGYATIPCKSR